MVANTARATFLDIAERVVVTAAESVLAVYVAKGSVSVSAAQIAILTGIAAGLAAVHGLVLALGRLDATPLGWLEDVAARAAYTFAQTLVAGLITAAATPMSLPSAKAAAIAALAAAFATVKGAVAQRFGSPNNAALLPKSPTHPAVLVPTPRELEVRAIPSAALDEEAIAQAVVAELAKRLGPVRA